MCNFATNIFLDIQKIILVMKKSLIRNLLILVAVAAIFGSCQRGYGCPYKFEAKSEIKK
jgi:hypothetical protein